jgi:nucleoid-associated protein YgaU
MSRRIRLTLAASFALAGYNLAYGQDALSGDSRNPHYLLAQQNVVNNNPAAGPANSSAPAGDDLAKLQAENAALKKEVADAAHTIAQLQAELAKAGIHHQAATASSEPAPVAAVPAQAADTSAAPAGPQRALPLDATNANVTAAAPGADAGPSRSYTIVKGDSLWKIAHKMYPGDTKNGVDKIQEANKDAIGGKPLKIGQVLIIPQ